MSMRDTASTAAASGRQRKTRSAALRNFFLGGVLALVLVDQKELDVLPGGQAVVYLQAGGALLAVDVYFRLVHMLLLLYLRWAVNSSIRLICFSTLSRAGPP